MNNEIWIALISAISGIATAAITGFIQWRITITTAGVDKKKSETKTDEQKKETKSGEQKIEKDAPKDVIPKQGITKNKWLRMGLSAIIVGVAVFFVMRTVSASTFKPTLSDAKFEFIITRAVGDDPEKIDPYRELSLSQGERISIETDVREINGDPYPNQLSFTYYFSPGRQYSGKVLPFVAAKSDTISVRIEDQVTDEVITKVFSIIVK